MRRRPADAMTTGCQTPGREYASSRARGNLRPFAARGADSPSSPSISRPALLIGPLATGGNFVVIDAPSSAGFLEISIFTLGREKVAPAEQMASVDQIKKFADSFPAPVSRVPN